MADVDILHQRLMNQMISHPVLTKVADVVKHLGAVQAQDYAAALWAIGLRLPNSTEAKVDEAIANGDVLRTHVMRPTWHFVPPDDIRWMLKLSASRIHKQMAATYRQVEVDAKLFARTNSLIGKALESGEHLTRSEIKSVLERAGISLVRERLGFLLIAAELDALVCNGKRKGKQFTYALLDNRAPKSNRLSPEEARATLAKRYFTSHGPATARDYAWWSGMTLTEAKASIEIIKRDLVSRDLEGQLYWSPKAVTPIKRKPQTIYLLPNFDEYTVAYADRKLIFDQTHKPKLDVRGQAIFQYAIILDGRIVGTWRRTLKKGSVIIEPVKFSKLNDRQERAFIKAAEHYAKFVSQKLILST